MRPTHLAIALVLLFTPGCATIGAFFPDPAVATAADRNHQVQFHLNTMRMALEQYATDNKGAYPEPAKLREQLLRNNYMPGNRFPQDPWGAAGQEANVITLAVADWKDANDVETQKMPSLAFAAKNLPAARRPGTIIYILHPESQTYSLYGVGDKLGRPDVVAAVSNGTSWVLPK